MLFRGGDGGPKEAVIPAKAGIQGRIQRMTSGNAPALLMIVHGVLAAYLGALPRLKQLPAVASRDVFGQSATCARWRKL
jgi:hypothetical protein